MVEQHVSSHIHTHMHTHTYTHPQTYNHARAHTRTYRYIHDTHRRLKDWFPIVYTCTRRLSEFGFVCASVRLCVCA